MSVLDFYKKNPINPQLSPFWILGLYALFATTINHCLSWLKDHIAWQALSGSIGGFLNYYARNALRAVNFPLGILSLLLVALGWAFLLPIFYIYNHLLEEKFKEKKDVS